MSHRLGQWVGLVVACVLLGLGLFLAEPVEATRGLVISLAAATPSGLSTALHFRASLSAKSRVEAGDVFRVADVPGYVTGSAIAPAGWETTPGPERPGRTGLAFTYRGPAPIDGPALIRGFLARSTSGRPRSVGGYLGRCHGPDGSPLETSGAVAGPGAVPEPAGVVTGTAGILILGFVYARRQRRLARSRA
jgi:hypothetical protein